MSQDYHTFAKKLNIIPYPWNMNPDLYNLYRYFIVPNAQAMTILYNFMNPSDHRIIYTKVYEAFTDENDPYQ